MSKYIIDGDFVEIATDKFSEEHGVKRGRLAYVAGHRALPISEEDPYTQRIKFTVFLCNGKHVDVSKAYLMDATSLAKVSDRRQKSLTKIFKEDFEEKNNESTD